MDEGAKKGICDTCEEEDRHKEVPLVKIGNTFRCSDCANQYNGDAEFDRMAYGEDKK